MSITKSPWFQIWVKPKETIRSILTTDGKKCFLFLCAIYGFPVALNSVQNFGFSATVPLWAILVGCLIVCTFVGLAAIYIVAWFLHICGRWIGGKGSCAEIRMAVAWSNVPNLVTLGIWCILFGMFGGQVLDRGFAESQVVGYQAGILFLLMLAEFVISIWGFVILLNTLAEVQQFSLWRAFFNLVIPFAGVVAFMWLLGAFLYGIG